MSQCSYCLLVCMCHSQTLNNKTLKKLHERALRLVYDDRQSTSVTTHHRNLRVLSTELYKVHHGLASELMNDNLKKKKCDAQLQK